MIRVKELVKLAADSMKNQTLHELLESDQEFQRRLEEAKQALKAVDKLDLSEEQKETIDTLITKNEEMEYDFKINCYMAGMLDAYEILRQFNLTKE